MRRALIVLIIFFPMLAWAGPSIVFQAEHHDFGSVSQGPLLEYSFEFTNTGPDELIVKEVNTS